MEAQMPDANVSPSRTLKWSRIGIHLGAGLAAMALLLLVASPLGWRAGWWHYRVSFFWLMPFSAYVAIAAVALNIVALGFGRTALGMRALWTAGVAIALGAALVYVPWQYRQTLNAVPRIHDISTDTDDPPAFVAALPARAAERANSTAYEGPEVARRQKAAYPDIAPLRVALPRAEAFKRALDAARAMPGWTIIASDPESGRIEANDTSRWFRFVDDVVIRVRADGAGSRIDVRSESRQGRSDFGVNARRVRAYLAELKSRVG